MIRGRLWDSAWIMGAPLIGLFLIPLSVFLPHQKIMIVIVAVLGMAHRIAPMALALAHTEVRHRLRHESLKFLVLPVTLVALCGMIGFFFPYRAALSLDGISTQPWQTVADLKQPLWALTTVYLIWNAWHFAMQDFGVLSIYRIKRQIGRRDTDRWLCLFCLAVVTGVPLILKGGVRLEHLQWGLLGISAISIGVFLLVERRVSLRMAFILPVLFAPTAVLWWVPLMRWATSTDTLGWLRYIPPWPFMWSFVLLVLNHYLVAIGLSSHVWGRNTGRSYWWFVLFLLTLGTALSILLFFDPFHVALRATPFAIGLLIGISFVHFLYDRWIWKLSDPQVRAAIGRDLFAGA